MNKLFSRSFYKVWVLFLLVLVLLIRVNPPAVFSDDSPTYEQEKILVWKNIINEQQISAIAIDANNEQSILVGTDKGLFRSLDDGRSWSLLSDIFTKIAKIVISSKDSKTIYLAVNNSPQGIFKSVNDGLTWDLVENTILKLELETNGIDAKAFYVFGNSNQSAFKLADKINSFSAQTKLDPSQAKDLIIDPSYPNIFYLISNSGDIYSSKNFGKRWKKLAKPFPQQAVLSLAINPNQSNVIYAGLDKGDVYVSGDRGYSWHHFGDGLLNKNIASLAISPSGKTLFAGTKEGLFMLNLDGLHNLEGNCNPSPLASNQTITGLLDNSDCVLTRGGSTKYFSDIYTINATAGQQISLVLTATYDSFLAVSDSANILLISDTRGPNDPLRLAYTPTKNETLTLTVSSSFTDRLGNYRLTFFEPNCSGTLIMGGTMLTGTLEESDCLVSTFFSKYFSDVYKINGVSGQQINIALTAPYSPSLVLKDSAGIELLSDIGSSNTPLRLAYTPTKNEALTLAVSSSSSEITGNYRLSFFEPDCAGALINPGATITGTLAESDCLSFSGFSSFFSDIYKINAMVGQQITVTMTAPYNPLMALKDSAGITLTSDSGSPNQPLKLTYTPTKNETLNLRVSSLVGEKTGDYTLTYTAGQDFSIAANPGQINATRGAKGNFSININRIGGFSGGVTITPPDTKAIKVKLTPATPQTTTGTSASFSFKVKKNASTGAKTLIFTGQDSSGKTRSATLTLNIQ